MLCLAKDLQPVSCKLVLSTDMAMLPKGKSGLLAGLAALSFNSATRDQAPTLRPPDTAAYLSNIAVDPQFRRYKHCLTSHTAVLHHSYAENLALALAPMLSGAPFGPVD